MVRHFGNERLMVRHCGLLLSENLVIKTKARPARDGQKHKRLVEEIFLYQPMFLVCAFGEVCSAKIAKFIFPL